MKMISQATKQASMLFSANKDSKQRIIDVDTIREKSKQYWDKLNYRVTHSQTYDQCQRLQSKPVVFYVYSRLFDVIEMNIYMIILLFNYFDRLLGIKEKMSHTAHLVHDVIPFEDEQPWAYINRTYHLSEKHFSSIQTLSNSVSNSTQQPMASFEWIYYFLIQCFSYALMISTFSALILPISIFFFILVGLTFKEHIQSILSIVLQVSERVYMTTIYRPWLMIQSMMIEIQRHITVAKNQSLMAMRKLNMSYQDAKAHVASLTHQGPHLLYQHLRHVISISMLHIKIAIGYMIQRISDLMEALHQIVMKLMSKSHHDDQPHNKSN